MARKHTHSLDAGSRLAALNRTHGMAVVCSRHNEVGLESCYLTAGHPGSLWFSLPCNGKSIFSGVAASQSVSSCADYGSNTLSVELSPTIATFSDDQCSSLNIEHGLGVEQLYLFLGAACTFAQCEGEPRPDHSALSSLLLRCRGLLRAQSPWCSANGNL